MKFAKLVLLAGLSLSPLAARAQFPGNDYDLYLLNPHSGSFAQLTTLSGTGEFNPDWSPDSRYVVHDVTSFDAGGTPVSQHLSVTEVATGVSTPLPDTDGGNDAAWSPKGDVIAFDRFYADPSDPSLYLLALGDTTATFLRSDALDPDWSPNGKYLVFQDNTDGSIRTLNLLTGAEHTIAASGTNPAWSPNGRRIAYSDGDDLYVARVNPFGELVGAPVSLTSDGSTTIESHPSWTQSSRSLVYQAGSGATTSFDLFEISITGGAASPVLTAPGTGEFDPAVARRMGLIVFAGYTSPSP